MKYKQGDRVRIKSLDWYNRYTNGTEVDCGAYPFTSDMKEFCGQERIIANVCQECYVLLGIDDKFVFTDEMIEGLVEESDDFEKMYIESKKRYKEEYSKGEYCHEQSFKWGFQEGYNYSHENDKLEISLKEGYQFIDENGNVINATKIVLEKKKKEYPKTYEECCKILGLLNVDLCFNADYRSFDASKEQWKRLGLMNQFYQLLICRDAYWKIAGEKMGLDGPWEPYWSDDTAKYSIYTIKGVLTKAISCYDGAIFVFPTEEMRDAFYENFDTDIKICKKFL